MIGHNLRIALRNLKRFRGYSFINIFGLAAGIACCMLIMVWVANELSFDRFHTRGSDMYRIYNELTLNGQTRTMPVTSPPLAAALTAAIPEVEQAVRVNNLGRVGVKYREREFSEEGIFWVDPSFLSLFSFPLRSGDPRSALTAAHTVVVTEKTAQRYFGAENPLGKTLRFSDGQEYTVTGVVREAPANSHLVFDMLCSFSSWVAENKAEAEQWGALGPVTYIRLRPGAAVADIEKKMAGIVEEKIGKALKQVGGAMVFHLQPLTRIHLHSHFEVDLINSGDISMVYLFSGAAFFILLIACVNFINLATARHANRALEVGLRKTMGASRASLVRQFLGETFLVTFLAVLLACLFAGLGLPLLNSLSGQRFAAAVLLQPAFVLGLLLLTLLVGLLAGIYPALFLSSFHPVATLKGQLKAGAAGSLFRRFLVIGQFAVSIALIIGTLVIFEQLRFLRNKDLGFDKRQVAVAALPAARTLQASAIRAELGSVAGVESVSLASEAPGQSMSIVNFVPQGRTGAEAQLMQFMDVDDRYLPLLGIPVIRGRNLSAAMASDEKEALLINQTAAARLGWADPIGKTLARSFRGPDGRPATVSRRIVGVVKDFHTQSLHQKIEPLVISMQPANFRAVLVKLRSGRSPDIMGKLKEKWHRLFPGVAFDFFFLDQSFNRLYRAEEQINRIFTSFALLAILISCLGLFGLAAYMTEKRTKEVGVRRALGASVPGIVALLSGEFARWVLLANLAAWPLAYLFLRKWLGGFAYRAGLHLSTFVLSGAAALLIAILTVSYQTLRAARANPIDSLHYE